MIVYSCSGCSSAAQTANYCAIQLDRQGVAEMSCIAGVGGGVKPLVEKAQANASEIIAIDGCPLKCCLHCLARHGIAPKLHFDLSQLKIKKKYHQDFDQEDAARALQHILQEIQKT